MSRIIDLSQEIYQGMPVHAGHLKTVAFQHHTHEDTAPNVDSGFSYQSPSPCRNANRQCFR